MSASDQAMGHLVCAASVCTGIGLAHTKHSLKSSGTNGHRSKAQGKGCQWTVTSTSAVAPPTLQAASQGSRHWLEL